MNAAVEFVHARLERQIDLLGPDARTRLHLARELRRVGQHRLASSIETEMLQQLGIDTLRGGYGSLADELDTGPPRGWRERLRGLFTADEPAPEIR